VSKKFSIRELVFFT
jgi:hypothetical protein